MSGLNYYEEEEIASFFSMVDQEEEKSWVLFFYSLFPFCLGGFGYGPLLNFVILQ